MVRKLLVLFATIALAGLCHAQADRLDAANFNKMTMVPGAQLVDVRTPAEFEKGHIQGARNIDWLEDGFMAQAGKLDRSKPVLLYCAAGGRSEEALAAMKKAGFTQAMDLKDGFNGWKRANMPVAK